MRSQHPIKRGSHKKFICPYINKKANQEMTISIVRDLADINATNDTYYVILTNDVLSIRILFEDEMLWFSSSNLQAIFNINTRRDINKRITQIYSEK